MTERDLTAEEIANCDPVDEHECVVEAATLRMLCRMAARTVEAEGKLRDDLDALADRLAETAAKRITELERQLADAKTLLASAAPLSWVCDPRALDHAHEWERHVADFLALDAPQPQSEQFVCPDCGPAIVDEDGCCHNCGADTEVQPKPEGDRG